MQSRHSVVPFIADQLTDTMNTLHLRSTFGTLLLFLAAGRYLAAQSITTMPLERGQYCAEDSITVSFKATGTCGANNRFIAQLSAKDGSWCVEFFGGPE